MTHFQSLFIKNLRTLRTKAGYSQSEFSEIIGISPNYLNAVENGKNFPSSEIIQKIIDSLKILPYQLFLETQNDSKANTFSKAQMQKIVNLKENVINLFDNLIAEKGKQ